MHLLARRFAPLFSPGRYCRQGGGQGGLVLGHGLGCGGLQGSSSSGSRSRSSLGREDGRNIYVEIGGFVPLGLVRHVVVVVIVATSVVHSLLPRVRLDLLLCVYQFALDLAQALAWALARALAWALARDLALIRALALARAQGPARAKALARF